MRLLNILLLIMEVLPINTKLPKICQTKTKPNIYRIEALQTCNNLKVKKVNVKIEVANVKIYKSQAKGIAVKRHICRTFTNLINEKSTDESTENVQINEIQAREMIKEKKCLSSNDEYRYGNFIKTYECDYSYMKHKTTVTNSCLFLSGFIMGTHNGKVSGSITDMAGCNYSNGYCKAGDIHVIWSPNEQIKEEYTDAQETECIKVNSHVICDKLSKSFNLEKFTYNESDNTFSNKMWRISIRNYINSTYEENKFTAESDLGKQIQALKSEIQSKFQYLVDWYSSPVSKMNIMCLSLIHINRLTRASIKLYATEFAEILSNTHNVIAKATENYIAVWPCKTINITDMEFVQKRECYNHIPIKYNSTLGFLDESLIYHKTATMINCQKTPIKLFEMNHKLYKQKQNHIPVEIGTEDVQSINYFTNFNFTKMKDLSDEWQIEPEYFDTTTGLIDNLKEDMEETKNAHKNMIKNTNTQVKLDLIGLKNLTPYGFIECAISWVAKVGGFIALYTCLRKGC